MLKENENMNELRCYLYLLGKRVKFVVNVRKMYYALVMDIEKNIYMR